MSIWSSLLVDDDDNSNFEFNFVSELLSGDEDFDRFGINEWNVSVK